MLFRWHATSTRPEPLRALCRLQAKDYIGKWVVLFFYPKDFTFVCPTEIIAFSDAAAAFAEKDCAVIGASTDSAEVHLAWINTPRKKGGLGQMKIPLLAVCSTSLCGAPCNTSPWHLCLAAFIY